MARSAVGKTFVGWDALSFAEFESGVRDPPWLESGLRLTLLQRSIPPEPPVVHVPVWTVPAVGAVAFTVVAMVRVTTWPGFRNPIEHVTVPDEFVHPLLVPVGLNVVWGSRVSTADTPLATVFVELFVMVSV
jgi:hypothetical protein